jgi:hypothetical protein
MDQDELLRRVTRVLERVGLRYLVTGSVATIFYGEPRFTADIDIVVDLPVERVRDLCQALASPEFYVSEDSARHAARRRSQFNVLHPSSGLKVDLMVSERSAFDRSRFERARRLQPEEDYQATFASPEDVILKKMEYFREGKSEKHLRDIDGVLKISGADLDTAYIDRWAEILGVREIWEEVRKSSR